MFPPFQAMTKTSMLHRPPPKKRAREFTEKESKQAETEIKEIEDFLKADVEPLIKLPKEKPTSVAVQKIRSKPETRAKLFQGLGRYTAELERKSADIPIKERHFVCNLCDNEFVFPKRCITHVVKTHDIAIAEATKNITVVAGTDIAPKKCEICGYVSKEKNQSYYYIHYHKYFRHGIPLPKGWEPYRCNICGKECFTKFQLKDHKLIHTEATPFVCETCGTGFKSRTCLNSHVYHKHTPVKKHPCHECDRAFKTKTQLLVHSRTHTGDKPFACPVCMKYRSTTRGNMRQHLTNKHKFPVDQIQEIMTNLKPSPEVVIETEDGISKFNPPTLAKPEKSSARGKTRTKQTEKNLIPNSSNSVMVLNDHGQVDILSDVKYIATDLARPAVDPAVDSLHPTITNMLTESLATSTTQTVPHNVQRSVNINQNSNKQTLLPYNTMMSHALTVGVPTSVNSTTGTQTEAGLDDSDDDSDDDDDDDDEPHQLVINTDQFSPSPSQYEVQDNSSPMKSTELLQDRQMAMTVDATVTNYTNEDMARSLNADGLGNHILVQDLRQVGNELKTVNNENILQFVAQPRQILRAGEPQIQSRQETQTMSPFTLPGGLQLHLHNIIHDKDQTLLQVQIQQPPPVPESHDQIQNMVAGNIVDQKAGQVISPVELVPIFKQKVPNSHLIPTDAYYDRDKTQEQNTAVPNVNTSVAYIMQNVRGPAVQMTDNGQIMSPAQTNLVRNIHAPVSAPNIQQQSFTDPAMYQFYQNENYQNYS